MRHKVWKIMHFSKFPKRNSHKTCAIIISLESETGLMPHYFRVSLHHCVVFGRGTPALMLPGREAKGEQGGSFHLLSLRFVL